jgi:transcription elongation factor
LQIDAPVGGGRIEWTTRQRAGLVKQRRIHVADRRCGIQVIQKITCGNAEREIVTPVAGAAKDAPRTASAAKPTGARAPTWSATTPTAIKADYGLSNSRAQSLPTRGSVVHILWNQLGGGFRRLRVSKELPRFCRITRG